MLFMHYFIYIFKIVKKFHSRTTCKK